MPNSVNPTEILSLKFKYFLPFSNGKFSHSAYTEEEHVLLFEEAFTNQLIGETKFPLNFVSKDRIPLWGRAIRETEPSEEDRKHITLIGPFNIWDLYRGLNLILEFTRETKWPEKLAVRTLTTEGGKPSGFEDTIFESGWREILQSHETPKLSIPGGKK